MVCGFFFKQKTAYEMRISDWSSDVCSSDLSRDYEAPKCGSVPGPPALADDRRPPRSRDRPTYSSGFPEHPFPIGSHVPSTAEKLPPHSPDWRRNSCFLNSPPAPFVKIAGLQFCHPNARIAQIAGRSEEHTYVLQSLMRISYAVF